MFGSKVTESTVRRWLNFAAGTAGAVVAVIAAAGAVWIGHAILSSQRVPAYLSLSPGAAICLLSIGIGLLFGALRRRRWAAIAAGLAILLIGLQIGAMAASSGPGAALPGNAHISLWISPNMAAALFFAAAAILVASLRPLWQARWTWSGFFGSLALAVAVVGLVGGFASIGPDYFWAWLIAMPVMSGAGLAILGMGLLALALSRDWARSGQLPTWLAPSAAVILVAMSFGAYFAIEAVSDRQARRALAAEAQELQAVIGTLMRSRVEAIERMAGRWMDHGGIERPEFEADARRYIRHQPGLKAIRRVGADNRARWSVLDKENRFQIDSIAESGPELSWPYHVSVGSPRSLASDMFGFVVTAPLFVRGRFDGAIQAFFRYDTMLENLGWTPENEGFEFSVHDGEHEVYRSGPGEGKHSGLLAEEPVAVHGAVWIVRVWPDSNAPMTLVEPLAGLVLLLGLMSSGLAGGALHFAQRSSRQKQEARNLNRSLAMEAQRRGRDAEEMDRLRRRIQLILDSAGEGIYGLDADGRAIFVNPAAAAMVDWSEPEIVGRPLHEMVHHSRQDGSAYPVSECPIHRTLQTGEVFSVTDEVFWRRDRSSFPVEYVCTPIKEDDSVVGAVVIFRDVSEKRRRETMLKQANNELEAFAHSVSHDLRAPLRAMDGFSRALVEDFGESLPEQAQDYLERIRTGAGRMAQMIDDLLLLSRSTRGDLELQDIDLSEMAERIVEELHQTEPKSARAHFTVGTGLLAFADPRLLELALRNLIENAWKYSARRRPPKIEVGCTTDGGRTVYYVRDNGVGFDMAYSDKLFQPFHRLHGVGEFPGTGIGLSIVARVIGRHGGEVWAESEPGKGATFYFTL